MGRRRLTALSGGEIRSTADSSIESRESRRQWKEQLALQTFPHFVQRHRTSYVALKEDGGLGLEHDQPGVKLYLGYPEIA